MWATFIEEEPIQIVNSIPDHDPAKQNLQMKGRAFIFEVDSGTDDNFCSTQVWMKLGKLTYNNLEYAMFHLQEIDISSGNFQGQSFFALTYTSQRDYNISSLPHLNLLSRMAIHSFGIDVCVLPQPGGNTCKDVVHFILEKSSPIKCSVRFASSSVQTSQIFQARTQLLEEL